ncbi:hypothetical protein XH83_24835 [Bradyrhizobium sp. CCBAU 53351]|nr:hypothetical protein XH83_24835 [Bradyrhizobium sp. CCBAU 53351]
MGGGGSPRSGETGEGSLSARNARRETPHPIELASTLGAALAHKGRGHSNGHRRCNRPLRPLPPRPNRAML